MKFGLIGYPLGHSWSKEIHGHFISHPYEMYEMKEEELDVFLKSKDFDGLNVTIPYKQTVILYLDAMDEACQRIGAVNCIVNENGKLKGYNTDYIGFMEMLVQNHVDVKDKNVAVLGTGGASKAICEALQQLHANITLVSRNQKEGVITYDTLYENEKQFEVIVNTTPIGMYPKCDEIVIDIHRFTNVNTVVDIIANPLMTRLQFEAKCMGIKVLGGFEMLVRQAFAADELFLHQKMDASMIYPCMNDLLYARRNIILIGMPTAGKTTICASLARAAHKKAIEMDDEIVRKLGTSIKECFASKGEAYFRHVETEVAKKHREAKGEIVSCGGGVITQKETMRYLSENGIVIWIKRDLHNLFPTDSRPLSSSEEAIKKMCDDRYPLYEKYSDIQIENNETIDKVIHKIITCVRGE